MSKIITDTASKIWSVFANNIAIVLNLFWKWIGAPLIAVIIGIMFLNRVTNWFVGPESYKIYVVGGPDERINTKMWDAFNGLEDGDIGGVKIKIVTISSDEDGAAGLSERLAGLDDTLMVVGHLYSTSSKSALPAYLNADPPIPVILPTETSPVVFIPSTEVYLPVFRLAPNDDDQAAKAADLIMKQGAKAIWVVEDESNSAYSHYLGEQFVRNIHEKKSGKVMLWTTTRGSPSPETLKALGIDGVFFAGHWSEGIILARNARVSLKNPGLPIVLSDWCADPALIEQGGADMKGVYLISPITAKEVYDEGFGYWGALAHQTTHQLLRSANERFDDLASQNGGTIYYMHKILNIHRVADARRVLKSTMEEHVLKEQPLVLKGKEYIFRHNGFARDSIFHIWQVRSQAGKEEFADVE